MSPPSPLLRSRLRSAVLLSLITAAPFAVGQCISLKDSKACPAWSDAQISTNQNTFSFLQFVTDTESFDRELESYISTTMIREKYELQFGCRDIDFKQASEYYARFTRTTICSSIVQASKSTCNLSDGQSRPVCVDTCAEFAQSEALLSSDPSLCDGPGPQLMQLIRADFTTCSIPDASLASKTCIPGIANEPLNCGFQDSTLGLCSYCGSGGINSTDTCCYNANAEEICKDVELPTLTATVDFTIPTPSSLASNEDIDDDSGGLSGGAIAGIVIGSIAGVLLLAGLLYVCIRLRGRHDGSQNGSVLNQPSPARQSLPMSQGNAAGSLSAAAQTHEFAPGGRIARMSALEAQSSDSPPRSHNGTGITSAAARSFAGTHSHSHTRSDMSDSYMPESSPFSDNRVGALRPPPAHIRRNESLSGSSAMGDDPQSPISAGMPSPHGVASQQSEQLPFFKDYYSQDDIHPGDQVAVLWAYQPRANDEFALSRGDMLKVVGIWDDGWATGIMLDESAEEWEAKRQAQRDSGVSNTSGRRDESPSVSGEIKAFPLVCVCLPQHWRNTITRDTSIEADSVGQ